MAGDKKHGALWHAHIQGYLLAGLLTITPLVVVWFVFDFFLTALSRAGRPLALALTGLIDENLPQATPWLTNEAVKQAIAVFVALLTLYLIGAIVSRVAGQRALGFFEALIARIPMVQTVYSAAKQLIDVLRQPPGGRQRVVLLDFPHEGMKALGFIMRSFADAKTGEELVAVYVPTAINPTSGFLQILPMAKVTPVDMAPDQAMTMIISGGAVTPERMTIAGE